MWFLDILADRQYRHSNAFTIIFLLLSLFPLICFVDRSLIKPCTVHLAVVSVCVQIGRACDRLQIAPSVEKVKKFFFDIPSLIQSNSRK